jgi:hypothetical protein
MIRSTDILFFAARKGLVLTPSLVRQALHSLDREALETAERQRWTAVPWDGTGDPPLGTRDRWVHDHDAIGRATQEAFARGKVVYFLLRDGKLHHYQPYRAYDRGHYKLEREDTAHPHYWQRAATDHIAREVEQAVDQQVVQLALDKALDLHEAAGIPIGIAPTLTSARREV